MLPTRDRLAGAASLSPTRRDRGRQRAVSASLIAGSRSPSRPGQHRRGATSPRTMRRTSRSSSTFEPSPRAPAIARLRRQQARDASTTRTASTSRWPRSRATMREGRSSRSRTSATTTTARSTSRARCARWSPTRPATAWSRGVVDHPAAGQDDPDQKARRPRRSARRPPTTVRPQVPASCGTPSGSRSTTPRTRSSSATSTPPTSATAPTASRPPRATTSTATPAKLNLAQAALLAGTRQEPDGLQPDQPPGDALERRNVVLDRMAELNVITRAQGREGARSRSSASTCSRADNGCVNTQAPFFCDYVHRLPAGGPVSRQDPRGAQAACSTAAA